MDEFVTPLVGQIGYESICTLSWYQEFNIEYSDLKNYWFYLVFYGLYQLAAAGSIIFPDLKYWALFIRSSWIGFQMTFAAEGDLMYSNQKFTELFNFGVFGIGFMPGMYRCGFYIFIRALWKIPYLVLIDQTWSKWFGRLVISDEEVAEEQETF